MTIAAALVIGYFFDLLLGDPLWLPHPVVLIGRLIAWLEKTVRPLFPATPEGERRSGALLVVIVCAVAVFAPLFVLATAYAFMHWFGFLLECLVCYQVLATRCLRDAAKKVYDRLADRDLAGARKAVGEIVGRDAQALDAEGITRATVETVAENSSDGVVAPMLFFAVGGAPLALLYKAINTMDSMLGYKNEKYLHFGRAAARLDDVANFVPARVTAVLMIPAAAMAGLDWRGALRIWRRDKNNHASPNAGHPEAACAGALGVRLGGDSSYGGKVVSKPTLGDRTRPLTADDIVRANRLLYATSILSLLACLFLLNA